MMRYKSLIPGLLLFFCAGCGTHAEETEAPAWEPEDAVPLPTQTGVDLAFPELEFPAVDCDEKSLADGLPRDTPRADSKMTLVERFGSDGCPHQRTRYGWEEGRKTLDYVEYLAPEWTAYYYVEPEDHSTAYFYGEEGQLVETRRAPSPDAPAQEVMEYAYDEQGRLILERRSSQGEDDGLHEVERKTWDFGQSPPSTLYQHVLDGELIDGAEKDFTESGELLSKYKLESDGTRWLIDEWKRDESDRPLDRRIYSLGGELFAEYSWTYHADGETEKNRVRHDTGWLERTRFDAAGNQTYYSQDSTGDGQPNYVKENRYEGNSMIYERVQYAFDANGEALTEKETWWQFDEQGRIVEVKGQQFHEPNVSIEPTRRHRTVEYLPDGTRRVDAEVRHLETGELMRATHTEFDAYGEPIWRHRFNKTLDSDTEARWMRTYNEGRPLLVVQDSTGDGVANQVTRYEYDAYGNLLEKSTDTNADGKPDSRRVKRYGTPSL